MSRAWLASVLSMFFLAVCGGGEEQPRTASPPAPPPTAQATPPAPPTPPPTPASAKLDCANPTGELRGEPARGAQLYAGTCASCHGAQGKGDGPASKGLAPAPADHTDPGRMKALSDADIYKVICGGGQFVGKSPLMAAWGPVVGDQGIRDLIAHIRTLHGG